MAVTKTQQGFRIAFVNHDWRALPLEFRPVSPGSGKPAWIDLVNGRPIEPRGESLRISIPAGGFRAVEFRRHQ